MGSCPGGRQRRAPNLSRPTRSLGQPPKGEAVTFYFAQNRNFYSPLTVLANRPVEPRPTARDPGEAGASALRRRSLSASGECASSRVALVAPLFSAQSRVRLRLWADAV